MASQGRENADKLAAEPFAFHNEKSSLNGVEGVLPHSEKPAAPIFNLVPLTLTESVLIADFPLTRLMTPIAPWLAQAQ